MGYLNIDNIANKRNNIAPPPASGVRLAVPRGATRARFCALPLAGRGFSFQSIAAFTTQVVTLWCFNTVATRRSRTPDHRPTARRRGARRHRLTAGAGPRAPRPHLASLLIRSLLGAGAASACVKRGCVGACRRLAVRGTSTNCCTCKQCVETSIIVFIAFMWRINPGAFLRESGTGTLQ